MYDWKLFLAEVAIGLVVLSIWSPVAGLLGIVQPWVTIIFMVAWIIFWNLPVGHRARLVVVRMIARRG